MKSTTFYRWRPAGKTNSPTSGLSAAPVISASTASLYRHLGERPPFIGVTLSLRPADTQYSAADLRTAVNLVQVSFIHPCGANPYVDPLIPPRTCFHFPDSNFGTTLHTTWSRLVPGCRVPRPSCLPPARPGSGLLPPAPRLVLYPESNLPFYPVPGVKLRASFSPGRTAALGVKRSSNRFDDYRPPVWPIPVAGRTVPDLAVLAVRLPVVAILAIFATLYPDRPKTACYSLPATEKWG